MSLKTAHHKHPIIFYDGQCALCDKSVQFIIRYDVNSVFRFAALQSNLAKELVGSEASFDSFILWDNNKVFQRSTAALKTLKKLGGLWQLAYVFMIVPSFIRDGIYNYIAKNRYQWFGKYDQCKIPTAEQRALFLDQ